MRRLTEILAFPKAWYRRSIVRRMFLGDLSTSMSHNDDDSSTLSSNTPNSKTQETKSKNDKSPLLAKDKLKFGVEHDMKQARLREMGRTFSTESARSEESAGPMDMKSSTAWETLVLFAINFKKLNVHMNMGNVMGNVV